MVHRVMAQHNQIWISMSNFVSVPCSWGTHSYCAKIRVVIRNYALRSW